MKNTVWMVGLLLCACLMQAQPLYQSEDKAIFARFMQYAEAGNQDISRLASFFMDTPYVGGTLEGDSTERLRINLRELDCFTFVENILALHLLLNDTDPSFERFCSILEKIRYRNGTLDGYLSRLHYTSEWLCVNEKKGILQLPDLPASEAFSPSVSFMSTHCDNYPALKAYPTWCASVLHIENEVNQLNLRYIPKERIHKSVGIQSGDVIAITTHIKGLDISHTGFALRKNGVIYLLHASSEAKKVVVSSAPLSEYLAKRKNHSGVIVGRALKQP
ncbi:xylanase [Bacteroidia bacterium]|nr:xylanase [Bacteroidia bacterium]